MIKGINIKLLEVLNSFYFWSSLSTTFVIGILSGALSIILTYGNLVFLSKNKNSTEFWFYSLIIFSPGILAVGYYIFFNQIINSTISNIFIIIPKQKKIKVTINITLLNSLAKYLFITKDLIIFFELSFRI